MTSRPHGVKTAVYLAAAVFALSNSRAAAQTPPGSAPSLIEAVQAVKPPVIDGVVAENEWPGAAVATTFIQYEPQQGSDRRAEPSH